MEFNADDLKVFTAQPEIKPNSCTGCCFARPVGEGEFRCMVNNLRLINPNGTAGGSYCGVNDVIFRADSDAAIARLAAVKLLGVDDA